MAYFGDATAHAAILGVALSLAFSLPIFAGALVIALVMASLVTLLSGRGYAMDTLLGVMAHSALAFGLVGVSFLTNVRIDIMAYLFGDILAVSRTDLGVIWGGAAIVLGLVAWRWSALLIATLNTDLARAAGVDPEARASRPDPRARSNRRGGDQGRGRAADHRNADHPRRHGAPLLADPRDDGRSRLVHRDGIRVGRVAGVLHAGYADGADDRLHRRHPLLPLGSAIGSAPSRIVAQEGRDAVMGLVANCHRYGLLLRLEMRCRCPWRAWRADGIVP